MLDNYWHSFVSHDLSTTVLDLLMRILHNSPQSSLWAKTHIPRQLRLCSILGWYHLVVMGSIYLNPHLHQQKCMLLENACCSLRCLDKHLKEPQAKSNRSKIVLFCAFQCFKKSEIFLYNLSSLPFFYFHYSFHTF